MAEAAVSRPPMSSLSSFGGSHRGSAVSQSTNVVIPAITSQQGSVCDSASSTLGGARGCHASAASFVWDGDGAHSQALISPVQLNGKKKGGILSGLKKMFQQHKADGRATVEGRRDATQTDFDASVSGGEAAGFLDPSISKMDRSLKPGPGLKVQVGGSSRDLTLAALLTSPVRAPAAPGSPAVLHSPMPSSMRLEHATSSNLSAQDVSPDVALAYSSVGGSGEQRFFPNFASRTGGSAAMRPSGAASPAGAPASHSSLVASLSSHLPAATRAPVVPQQVPQTAFQKSLSTAFASPSGSSGGASGLCPAASGPLVRGDSAEEYQRGVSTSNSGRVALPYLTSARASQDPPGPSVSSPGRMHTASTSQMPVPDPVPEAVYGAENGEDAEEGEEDDDVPGTMLLGMNPAVPQRMRRRQWCLDDYQVIKRMYKGATSAVYRATCLRSGLTVALKVYFLSRVPINVVHMIRREIELHVPLVHRNIVMLYGAFQDEKHIVLVEEFAARGDLFGIHRSMNCRLTETQTSELILAPFLDSLSYLHARGIMHRDIKPENILFTQDWVLKVADFGVSINVHDERAVTRTGTADYMAPEVERCPLKHAPEDNKDNPNLAYTTAIDIWSVGVLAYEMLVGFPPFVSSTADDAAGGAGAGGGGGGGASGSRAGVAAFMAEQATRKTLRFPASVSAAAKDFIMATLNENPGDRPTAQQLLKHPWLFRVARRPSVNSTSRFSNPNVSIGGH